MRRLEDVVLTRRRFLAVSGLGALGITVTTAFGSCASGDLTGDQLTSDLPLPAPFGQPLTIPAEARGVPAGDRDVLAIVQRSTDVEILPGVRTRIWGYDGTFPGPTVRARSERELVVRHRNELPVPTSVHLHGGHTPPDSDGYPTDLVMPAGGWRWGSSRYAQLCTLTDEPEQSHVYPHRQRAATLWYHDHRMDFTGPQVWRGLAGFHLISDRDEDALSLPDANRELPLMICDRTFDADGQLKYPSIDPGLRNEPGVRGGAMRGVLGDVICVNGRAWPTHEVAATTYRLRLLNASNARRYRLRLDPAPPGGTTPFTQIGSDGGLLTAPIAHDSIVIAQGERFDVLVDFGAYPVGTRITVRNDFGSGRTKDVMQFHVVRPGPDDVRLPRRLSDVDRLREDDAVRTRQFRFETQGGGWSINDKLFDPLTALAEPRLGDIEIWELQGNAHHPIHIHLDAFQVISRTSNGGRPGRYDAGWKDTLDLAPGEQIRLLIRFTDYPGRYVMHCHNLEHEDMAMMGNIVIRGTTG